MVHRNKYAHIATRILDPLVFVCIFLGALCIRSHASLSYLGIYFSDLIVLILFPALAVLYFFQKKHLLADWDVSNRKERIRLFIVLSALFFPGVSLVVLFGNNVFTIYTWVIYAWFLGHLLVTLFWKQSGHTGMATLVLGIFFVWYGMRVVPFFFLVPFIAWTRIVLGKHTVFQTIGGSIYSLVFLYGLYIIGLL